MLKQIPIQDGLVYIDHGFLSAKESEALYQHLLEGIQWEQEEITLFGKKVLQPRMHAWYGDKGLSYTYSGLTMKACTWTDELFTVKEKIEKAYAAKYNSVLLNLYRSGKDSMGWHSDDEAELRRNPVIASLSLGAARRFHLKHKTAKEVENKRLDLGNGSLLIMAGETQHYWKHQISKTAKEVEPRINLTFRYVHA